jgi:hypothetical protein
MTLPFTLPDWLPWWSVLVVLVPVLIYLLAFLAMPFSTIGVKARLDQLDARFDELQDEIRAMPHRMPPERGPQRAPETRESVSRGAGFRAPETREFELPRVEQDRSDYDAVVDVPPEAPVAPPAYRPTLLPDPRAPRARVEMPRMDLSPDGGSRSGQPSPVAPDRSFRSPAPSDPPRRPPPRRDDPSGRAEPRIEWPR